MFRRAWGEVEMKPTQEQQGNFAAALAAYQLHNKSKTTAQLGIEMGIPEDYNKRDAELVSKEDE